MCTANMCTADISLHSAMPPAGTLHLSLLHNCNAQTLCVHMCKCRIIATCATAAPKADHSDNTLHTTLVCILKYPPTANGVRTYFAGCNITNSTLTAQQSQPVAATAPTASIHSEGRIHPIHCPLQSPSCCTCHCTTALISVRHRMHCALSAESHCTPCGTHLPEPNK
jgi:hypothetical protein